MSVAAEQMGRSLTDMLADTSVVIYGTTRAINAIVTGTTARTALLTTEGFPDVLVLKDGGKSNPHDFTQDYPSPYIPRRLTFEISERVSSEGEVVRALDEGQALETIKELKRRKVEAVAVMFLWSTVNAANEQRMGQLLSQELPGVPYTLSHELVPVIREYRRASASAIDASLKPLIQSHLADMEADLRAIGYSGEILVSTSMGGCMHVDQLIQKPIHVVKSGPSMAPLAGAVFADFEGASGNVIIADTGGTTFDVGLARNGQVKYSRETWIGEQWTGHNLGVSSVDVRSVGSGGGSIAWIDPGGLLRVGPQSAGSEPGPACYGRGGTAPTVTDAACVLGFLDPGFFLGGRMALDVEAARSAIGKIAEVLKLPLIETAFAIIRLASESMIKAIADITIAEGQPPSESVIVAGGGAAGLNIGIIARELGCTQVILPKTAGVLSASGMQYADIVTEESGTLITESRNFKRDAVNDELDAIERRLMAFLERLAEKNIEVANYEISFFVEARYLFQIWELEINCPFSRVGSVADEAAFIEAFHREHERIFAVRDEEGIVEFLNWRGRLSVALEKPTNIQSTSSDTLEPSPHAMRSAYFGDELMDAPIFKGDRLEPGAMITGPAIIEEPTTTIVVYPNMAARVSASRNYVLNIQ